MKGLCSLVLICTRYRQASDVFMGTSPTPELANNFAFWHEYEFLSHMVNEYKQIGPSRYPFQFINQFATRTKRYIDDVDVFTVSLGHMSGTYFTDGCYFVGRYLLRYEPYYRTRF